MSTEICVACRLTKMVVSKHRVTWNCPGTHLGFDERCQRRQQAARPRSCPTQRQHPTHQRHSHRPRMTTPRELHRPGTGRCRPGRAEQSRFIWRPSSRVAAAAHSLATRPTRGDGSCGERRHHRRHRRGLYPSAPNRNEGFETTRVPVHARCRKPRAGDDRHWSARHGRSALMSPHLHRQVHTVGHPGGGDVDERGNRRRHQPKPARLLLRADRGLRAGCEATCWP